MWRLEQLMEIRLHKLNYPSKYSVLSVHTLIVVIVAVIICPILPGFWRSSVSNPEFKGLPQEANCFNDMNIPVFKRPNALVLANISQDSSVYTY
jgi:hypothetical protein